MIIEEILKQRLEGIKNEKGVYVTPAFPKLIYVLDEHNCLKGGKYDLNDTPKMVHRSTAFCRNTSVEVRIPDTTDFDTYALKGASQEEIKSVEQGKNK